MALLQVSFYSNVLQSGCSMNVILPQTGKDFESGPRYNDEGKIPVLWLLHGMGDDQTFWQRYTSVECYVAPLGIAVVMPFVLNQSMYCNMIDGNRYFDFIADELPKICSELFPQISNRGEDNFIAGLSMGCYGAFKIGLTYPERYAALGCFSLGNLIYSSLPDIDNGVTESGILRNSFGTKTILDSINTQNDIFYLAKQAIMSGKQLPKIFHCCGSEDPLLPIAKNTSEFFSSLAGNPFKYEYYEGPGGHVWGFWDEWLQKFLNTLDI